MLSTITAFASTNESNTTNKFVGAMYSVWFDYVNQRGLRPIFPSEVNPPGFRYWGEPNSGRYMSSNPQTINRHALEMANIGIDFIFVDLSNTGFDEPLHLKATFALLDEYQKRHYQKLPYPKVTFLLSLKNNNELTTAYNEIYSRYIPDIFFNVASKPLVLVNNSCDTPSSEKFHCKATWGLGAGKEWSFMELTPQKVHYSHGWSEQMPVSVAQQETFMSDTSAHGRKYDYKSKNNKGYEGQNLHDQWQHAYNQSPTYILVKAYNEWVAQKLNANSCNQDYCYVDNYNREFSIDIEPMKTCKNEECESHGDLYYKKMKQYINEFKSTSANFLLRNASDGKWIFRYGKGEKRTANKNYTAAFNWAKGSHYQMLSGDFNSDGLNDIGLRDTSNGKWHFAFNNGNGHYHHNRSFNWASGTHYQPLVGDFNDDGKTDIALRDTTNGKWHLSFFNGNNWYNNSRNFNWASGLHFQPIVGDFNGDGKTDIAMRDSSNGRWHFAFFNGNNWYNNSRNFDWASGGHYQPISGDFNCDNVTDIGLRDSNTGKIYLTTFDGNNSYNNKHNYQGPKGKNINISTDQIQCIY
jgi:hypothetical protein